MRELFLKKAEENFPEVFERTIVPELDGKIMTAGEEIVIDLGNHYVGYFSFKLNYVDVYIDAPVKLCIRFCEAERELYDDYTEYKGELCPSWLQEEIINIDFPGEYKMPRRYAARFIKIKVVASPQKVLLSDFAFKSVTSACGENVKPLSANDEELRSIDKVAMNTLKSCMQRVFEDGPKRDRRLWSGDLRLEALTNYYTFNNLELVRRCMYLFAALPVSDNGFIPSYVYENPHFVQGDWGFEDYALLYVQTICDYYNHTGDRKTFLDLYPVIKEQMEAAHKTLDKDGIVSVVAGSGVFIDWCPGLRKITAFHGVYMYVLSNLAEALRKLSHEDAGIYEDRYQNAKECAFRALYDKEKNAFVNAKDGFQYSVHSSVWMILGGAVEGEEAQIILDDVLASDVSIKPFTPYMHHYVTEAIVKLGMLDKAKQYIKDYWGDMVKHGADTFYEVYVKNDADFSPYKDRMINSMCHAWSCTPSYFIRKYFEDNEGNRA